MEAHGGERRYSSYSYSTSTSALAALYPGERTPGTHWKGVWVGPRAGLETETRRKIICLCRRSNPCRPVRSQSLYDWATPALHFISCCYILAFLRVMTAAISVTTSEKPRSAKRARMCVWGHGKRNYRNVDLWTANKMKITVRIFCGCAAKTGKRGNRHSDRA
jgi:hypothetical protein